MADEEPPIPKTAKGFLVKHSCESDEMWLGAYCARDRPHEDQDVSEVDPRKWSSWCWYDAARRGYSTSESTNLQQYSAYRLAQRINNGNPLASGIAPDDGWQPVTQDPEEVKKQAEQLPRPRQPGTPRIEHNLCPEEHQCESVFLKDDKKWHIFCAELNYVDDESEAELDADNEGGDADRNSDCGQSGNRHLDEDHHSDPGGGSDGEGGGNNWDLSGLRRYFGANIIVDSDIDDASLELLLFDDKHKQRVELGKDVSILLNGVGTPLCTTAYDTFGSCEPATSHNFKAHDKIEIHFSVYAHSLPANLHFGLTSLSKCLPP